MTDTVFALGSNGQGQLGLSHQDDISIAQSLCTKPDVSVREIAAGGNHTLMLTANGALISHGLNDAGQLFQSSVDEGLPTQWAQVTATWTASIFLSQEGRLFTCGEGLSGELGLGPITQSPHPQQIDAFPPNNTSIVQIASSMAHTVAVLSNGQVWGWGKNRKGQIGEPAEDVWKPRMIAVLAFRAVKAVCGKDFTCIIGDAAEGRLTLYGIGKNDRFALRSKLPSAIPSWKNIAASWGSIYILKQDGELLGFGRDDHGQLPPPGLPPFEAIAAGSEHCLALTKAGKVLAWGWGEHGNCGGPTDKQGDVRGGWNEIEVNGAVKAVFAGCATSFIVTTG